MKAFRTIFLTEKQNTLVMKKILYILIPAFWLMACDSNVKIETETSEEAKPEEPTASVEPVTNWEDINTNEALVATALMAAPEESREACTVIGFDVNGDFVTFKEGTNDLICIVDNLNQKGFNAACYHKSLEPFMARGRELKAEGKNPQEIFDIREQEAKDGLLVLGDPGATLHIYYGPESRYDPETNEVEGAKYRYVVYIPWATSASTGLPESPIAPNHPWIMNPGTHRAHIMITPVSD